VVVQERGGDPQEALANRYQPPGDKRAGTRFRKVLFHLHGEYRSFWFHVPTYGVRPVRMSVGTHGTIREVPDGFSRNLVLEEFFAV
jgi:hypothetical protein